MTQSQIELYKELEAQGMPKAGCRFIAQQFQNQKKEHIMMKYLISIRKEYVTITQVSRMAEQIQKME